MAALAPAFADPVTASQGVFRTVMNAMARPGATHRLNADLTPPAPLGRGAAALALALLDYECAAWFDYRLAAASDVGQWLRFHTGASVTSDPAQAAFAFISDAGALPAFDAFALGSAEYPDRSTTLIVEVAAFGEGTPLRLAGPGIAGVDAFSAAPLPVDFADRLRANRALFPRGVDLIFVCDDLIAALPRSTRVIEEG